MKVDAIQNAVQSYYKHLNSGDKYDYIYLFEITDQFHNALTKGDTILKSIVTGLQSNFTQRLWLRERYEPKKTILQLGSSFPEYFNDAINDLFNEDKLLENRIDRFKFYCDELLNLYKKKNKQQNINHHYIDEAFISCLLMGKYPATYAYYDHKLFLEIAKKVGAKPVPKVHDYPRYHKFVTIFNQYITKNDGLLKMHQKRNTNFDKPANLAVECMAVETNRDLLDH